MDLIESNAPPSPVDEAPLRRTPVWLDFPVLVLDFEFEMQDRFKLPFYSGSLFRGVLGWALKEVCGPEIYRYLFETESRESGHQDAPRPFILVPALGARELEAGDLFRVTLKLFGRGCEYLPEMTEALMLAGEQGLGKEKAGFALTKIVHREGPHPWVCFHSLLGWEQAYQPLPSPLGLFSKTEELDSSDRITVDFLTPTRLIHRGQRISDPDLHVLVRNVVRRLNCLLAFHGGKVAFDDPRPLIELASQFKSEHQLEWVDWERTSNRQKRRITMGGVVGRSVFRGSVTSALRDVLKAAEVLHLGKSTTFGMGSVAIF